MNHKVVWERCLAEVGGLSTPSKMPCRSWSTPAKRCITGSVLAKQAGTICSKCYARKGMYVLPNVEAAMERRFQRLMNALDSDRSMARLEESFETLMDIRFARTRVLMNRTGKVGRDDGRYFRWHDSGDLHGVEHLAMLNRIAVACPGTAFWLPTKEPNFVRAFLETSTLASNLIVRLSIPRFNADAPPAYLKLVAESPSVVLAGAHTEQPKAGFEQCNAIYTDHACAECRACWGHNPVSYTVI